MTISQSDLEQRFSELSDEELLRRCQSGDLTDMAQDVAQAELAHRGLKASDATRTKDSSEASGEHGDLLTVVRYFNPTEAHLLRGFFDSEGIPAFVADGNLVQANSFLTIAVGGVRVLVHESRFEEAKALLKRFNAGEFELSEDTDVGDFEDP